MASVFVSFASLGRIAIRSAGEKKRRPGGALQIRDVAKLAGVSPITVSRYFNNPEKVAISTRVKIAAAVEKTGYIPNLVAKGLSSNKTNVVAAIVPTITNSIFADYITGIADTLEQHGHQLLISTSGYSLETEEKLVRTLIAQRPAGLIITGQLHTSMASSLLHRVDTPVVETWETGAPPIDMGVGFSNSDACFAMTKALIDKGYRKIAFVSAPIEANDRATRRQQGYLAAMEAAKLEVKPTWVREAKFSYQEGVDALRYLVDKHSDLEAVFLASDVLAIGAATECQRLGIAVPDDLALCGFDDLQLASLTMPPLTTVNIPRYEIGVKAAEMVLSRNAGESVEQESVDLGFSIYWRDSTR